MTKMALPVWHGIWRILPSPALTELLAQAGLDFQILDCEHGSYDYQSLLMDIVACDLHRCRALVRVGGLDAVAVQRCLDLGAGGIVFPQLSTPGEFARAAAMMDYAPAGTRGFNPFVRAGDYGVPRALAARETRAWCVPIIETLAAVESVPEVLQLPRVDLIYIGSYDLSAQLGFPGDMNHPRLQVIIERILELCGQAGKPVGVMALTEEAGEAWRRRGVRALVHGVESHRFKQAIAAVVAPYLRS